MRIGDFGSAMVDFESKEHEHESWDCQGITHMFASANALNMGRPCRGDDIHTRPVLRTVLVLQMRMGQRIPEGDTLHLLILLTTQQLKSFCLR